MDDPANASFLRALATGRTPKELVDEASGGEGGNVVVGLVDKRSEDYVETFRSFQGEGTSLGSAAAPTAGSGDRTVFDPSTLAAPAAAVEGTTTTSIQVRLANGQRRVVKLPVTATVSELAANVIHNNPSDGIDFNFQLLFGFPPKPLDGTATIDSAGLKGAQVSMRKV